MPRVSFDMRLLREQDVWEMLVVPVGGENAIGHRLGDGPSARPGCSHA